MNSKPILKLNWATHSAAKLACTNWHYSKSIPVPPLVKIGVWEDSKFIGVVLFSRGANNMLLKPYGLDQTEGCELTRIALKKHKTPVSKIMSIAIKFLIKNSPNLKLIVSYADASKGHHGGIYQATNWTYVGTTSKDCEYWKGSRRYHSRQVSERGYTIEFGEKRKCPKPSECIKVITPGKHKYLLPLTDDIREKISKLAKPYPKRASSIESGTSGFQSEGGGESPTDALQSQISEV